MTTTTTSRPRLSPGDPAGIDSLLSEEELAIRETVRSFCADKVLPFVGTWYEQGELPAARDLARELGRIGLLGMHLSGAWPGSPSAWPATPSPAPAGEGRCAGRCWNRA